MNNNEQPDKPTVDNYEWVASRRRSNVILAVVLALVAVGFFCSAWLINVP